MHSGIAPGEGQALIAAIHPPHIAAAAGSDRLELLRQRMLAYPLTHSQLGLDDAMGALGTFLLVVLATFPVVIPFLLIDETRLAIRLSNLVGLGLLFAAGWVLARYFGGNAWWSGVVMAVVGTALMFAIVALGG